jgi:hypothetical protein
MINPRLGREKQANPAGAMPIHQKDRAKDLMSCRHFPNIK